MRKFTKIAGALCMAVMTAAMSFSGIAATAVTEPEIPAEPLGPVLMDGTVVSVEGGRLTMLRRGGDIHTGEFQEEIIVNLGEDTKILDSVNGLPVPMENLGAGEAVRVYAGPAMTMSIPAQTNGVVVLADVPADAGFPSFTAVKECKPNGAGGHTLTTTEGISYTVTSSTALLPYLTRNIVGVDDLTAGREILLWSQGSDASKVVLFQSFRGENGESAQGWYEENGNWFYSLNGGNHTGWLFDNGDWYYLNPETGIMETGFILVDGKAYYMEESGRMLTEARVFTPDENGVLH